MTAREGPEITRDLYSNHGRSELPRRMPQEIIRRYRHFSTRYNEQTGWQTLSEPILWSELCLCILSSNVHFETAQSAVRHLFSKRLLDKNGSNRLSRSKIAVELTRPIYLPPRKDGSLRRYRFPNVRASNLVVAWDVLYRRGDGIKTLLTDSNSVDETRLQLVRDVPGIGLKEASHFLRNVKFADSIAIIDTHVVRFLNEFLGLEVSIRGGITKKDYLELESLMRNLSARYQLSLAPLDMAIWDWMREKGD